MQPEKFKSPQTEEEVDLLLVLEEEGDSGLRVPIHKRLLMCPGEAKINKILRSFKEPRGEELLR